MSITPDGLYGLLPAAYRSADTVAGGTIRALLEVLAAQFDALDADLVEMEEGWFIETCPSYVVPYIGELVGEHLLAEVEGVATPRARIANTIGYRRRKGTVAVLEALARDTTGWPTRAVEYFRLLQADQHLADIRLERSALVSLRDADALELVDGPFDTAPHTVDVRRIATAPRTGRGRHNIPNIGLHAYRVGAYWVPRATPLAVTPGDGRYFIDPLGRDIRLFNRPAPETDIDHLATEVDVAAPLRRRPLHDELERRRDDLAAGRKPRARWFGDRPPVRIFRAKNAGDPVLEVPPHELEICHLGDLGGPPGWRRPDAGRVSVDPVLGRVAFPSAEVPETVLVSAAYGFGGDLGAGAYDRSATVTTLLDRPITWQVGVSRDTDPVPQVIFASLGEAIAEWNLQPDGTVGLIAVMDSDLLVEDVTGAKRLLIGEGSSIAIVAAGWPELPVPGGLPGQVGRQKGRITATGVRPTLTGDLEVRGTAPDDSLAAGVAIVDGLLIGGRVTVSAAGTKDLGRLTVAHCTVEGGVRVTGQHEHLAVVLKRSVVGPVKLAATAPVFRATDCVIDDRGAAPALDAEGAAVELEGVTVLGRSNVREIEASNSIFTDRLVAVRTQTGCVRYSALARNSVTSRRYRCQPDTALTTHPELDPDVVVARTAPSFTSLEPGEAGYAQLGRRCPPEITTGAEDGSEMGAFRFLHSPQRTGNLLASLDEYLRFGLDAALIPET
jgi:hypothetical protein